MDDFDQNQNVNDPQITDNPVPNNLLSQDQNQVQSSTTSESNIIEDKQSPPKIESTGQNISELPIIKKGYGDVYEEEGVKEVPISQITTAQTIFEDTKQYPQAQKNQNESPSTSGSEDILPPFRRDEEMRNTIDKLAVEAVKEPVLPQAEAVSTEKEEVPIQTPPSNLESSSLPQSSTPPINTTSENRGVSMADNQFVEKLDLEPNAQQVFEKASVSDNPEQVFDAVEQDKDRQLAQELIQKSGLSPELVKKALQQKTQKIQEEQSSTPPKPVSEVTAEEAKAVLGEEEYQKETQSIQPQVDQSTTEKFQDQG